MRAIKVSVQASSFQLSWLADMACSSQFASDCTFLVLASIFATASACLAFAFSARFAIHCPARPAMGCNKLSIDIIPIVAFINLKVCTVCLALFFPRKVVSAHLV